MFSKDLFYLRQGLGRYQRQLRFEVLEGRGVGVQSRESFYLSVLGDRWYFVCRVFIIVFRGDVL